MNFSTLRPVPGYFKGPGKRGAKLNFLFERGMRSFLTFAPLTMKKKEAIIIGAGVAGLSAGCYLQLSGFQTCIFEAQKHAGGLCTSWKKGAYTFESGFQWLLGSSPANPFYKLWSELIDIDSIPFINHESRMDIELRDHHGKAGEKVFHLYSNLGQLETYLLEISPEDNKQIKDFIRKIRRIQSLELPPKIREVPRLLPFREKIRYMRYLPMLLFLYRLQKETNLSFAARLKSPFLKEAFSLLFDGDEMPLPVITIPLAFNDLKAAGYPVGGSSAIVERLLEKYLALGGEIRFDSTVNKILVDKGHARGVHLENGSIMRSDVVVSCADWHFTVFKALEGRFVSKRIIKLASGASFKTYPAVLIVSLGIGRNLDDLPHFLRFPLDHDLCFPDGSVFSRLETHIYNYDPTMAPEGKTVISVCFYIKDPAYWVNLRKDDRSLYMASKKQLASEIVAILDKKFGRIREYVEETDVATPATFFRYTGNWKSAAQAWFPVRNMLTRPGVDICLPKLKGFYYAGHWTSAGGGLPVAIKSARDAVQVICRDFKQKFDTGTNSSAAKNP